MIYKTVYSLCDYSGNWARPFLNAEYRCILIDPKHESHYSKGGLEVWPHKIEAVLSMHKANQLDLPGADGVLMAPDCNAFAASGAQWWPAKDADGRTGKAVAHVRACLAFVKLVKPRWWCLENPIGRLHKLVPELGKPTLYFQPHHYAGWADNQERERYTKRTGLYGKFCTQLPEANLAPIVHRTKDGKRGSWQWAKLGGKSERTKELRSTTPVGFSRAFAAAQVPFELQKATILGLS